MACDLDYVIKDIYITKLKHTINTYSNY